MTYDMKKIRTTLLDHFSPSDLENMSDDDLIEEYESYMDFLQDQEVDNQINIMKEGL